MDITKLLNDWPYDPKDSVRKVTNADSIEKIQVRVDQGPFQGVLQMELDGRPDGKRPYNKAFALDDFKDTLETHRKDRGSDEGFGLNSEACEEIFDEGRTIYERYVFLLQVEEYERVVRDTERNMELFRFVNRYAEEEEDRVNLERWWPYIIRIHAVARATLATRDKDFDFALNSAKEARKKIDNLEEIDFEEFHAEKSRSLKALEKLIQGILEKRPLSISEKLKKGLTEAILQEEFEKAASIRDQIQDLEQDTNSASKTAEKA